MKRSIHRVNNSYVRKTRAIKSAQKLANLRRWVLAQVSALSKYSRFMAVWIFTRTRKINAHSSLHYRYWDTNDHSWSPLPGWANLDWWSRSFSCAGRRLNKPIALACRVELHLFHPILSMPLARVDNVWCRSVYRNCGKRVLQVGLASFMNKCSMLLFFRRPFPSLEQITKCVRHLTEYVYQHQKIVSCQKLKCHFSPTVLINLKSVKQLNYLMLLQ